MADLLYLVLSTTAAERTPITSTAKARRATLCGLWQPRPVESDRWRSAMQVGYLGVGNMGPMAGKLLDGGHGLLVYAP